MTPQEALNRIDGLIANEKLFIKISTMGEIDHSKNIEALEIAKQVLEKQMPKKPKGKTDPMFGDTTIVCPNCGNANLDNPFDISRVYDYCPNCGQALDWGG